MTATGIETTADTLAGLDWDHVIPCEYPERHGHKPAVWRVTFQCCPHALLCCQMCRANWFTNRAKCQTCATDDACLTCTACKAQIKHDDAIWGPLT